MPQWTWNHRERNSNGTPKRFLTVGFGCLPAVGSAPDAPSSRLPLQVLLRLTAAVLLAVWWRTGRVKHRLWRGLRGRANSRK